jgi:hypothetical protein
LRKRFDARQTLAARQELKGMEFMTQRKTKGAFLAEANEILANGGVLRFTWGTGQHVLITESGDIRPLDGRAYQTLTRRADLTRTETGSTENKDLVIEWRKKRQRQQATPAEVFQIFAEELEKELAKLPKEDSD